MGGAFPLIADISLNRKLVLERKEEVFVYLITQRSDISDSISVSVGTAGWLIAVRLQFFLCLMNVQCSCSTNLQFCILFFQLLCRNAAALGDMFLYYHRQGSVGLFWLNQNLTQDQMFTEQEALNRWRKSENILIDKFTLGNMEVEEKPQQSGIKTPARSGSWDVVTHMHGQHTNPKTSRIPQG